jgi:hypothetical protein
MAENIKGAIKEYLDAFPEARQAMQKEKSFTARNKSFWDARGKSDKTGLTLLDEAITNLAEHNNWDNLSRFISRAGALNATDRGKIVAVVRAAFGDQVSYKKSDHPTGGTIKLKDDKQPVLLNSYGAIRVAIEAGKGFRDADMHKKLREMEKGAAPPPANADVERSAKHIVKYIQGLRGVTSGVVLHEVEKMLKAAAATAAKPVVLDKDGEPNH